LPKCTSRNSTIVTQLKEPPSFESRIRTRIDRKRRVESPLGRFEILKCRITVGRLDTQDDCGNIPKSFMGAQDTRELLPGTLDMLILKVLSRGEMHGYGIVSAIQRASDDVLGVMEGALYPALHRLEVRGWVRSKWGTSDNNRRAKFYRLSVLGRRALDDEAAYWTRVASAVTRVMQTG
jgi:PadR family transcriptional regulator